MKTAINLTIFALLANITCAAQTANVPAPTPYKVIHRDANSEILQQTYYETSRTGKAIPHVRSVTKIATGLNFWDGTKWTESDPTFQISADDQYVYANKLQTRVRLSADLAASNSVTITTSDGIVLNTTPVAVGLYDAASGNSRIIAHITDCTGALISSNQVLYENAFDGISADVLYTLQRGSFSQDIVWKQNIDPADYGFPTNSTRIQIFTAFNSPEPQQIARPIYVETNQTIRAKMASPDFVDHTLKFGQLKFGPGRAFPTVSTNQVDGAPVGKEFGKINGQSYLIESVEYKDIKRDLRSLSRASRSPGSKIRMTRNFQNNLLNIPISHSNLKATFSVNNRRNMFADAIEPKGVVADYIALPATEPDPMVFQGDTTYFVDGSAQFDDVVLEGGTCIKYPNHANAAIWVNGNLTCDTGPYLPAVFTAADDDSIGQSMNGIWPEYTGTIQTGGYAVDALKLVNPAQLTNCRFSYANWAVLWVPATASNDLSIYDCQFVGNSTAVFDSAFIVANQSIDLENCLITAGANAVSDNPYGSYQVLHCLNCTFDNCTNILRYSADDTLYATNCIFSDIGSIAYPFSGGGGGGFSGSYGCNNGFYNCSFSDFGNNPADDPNPPYQTAGAGDYYLADNTFRGQGTANIDPALLADLAQKTTWPPFVYDAIDLSFLGTLPPQALRDTNSSPDLGYHYSPIDYLMAGCDLETNLIVKPGTAIGWFDDYDPIAGIPDAVTLNDGANLYFSGTVTEPCVFARNVMVQENGNINWYNDTLWASGAVTFNGSGDANLEPQLSGNFSKWTSDNTATFLRDYNQWEGYAYGQAALRNCEFYNASMSTYNMQSLTASNCLLFRMQIDFWDQDYAISYTFENCTFYNGGIFSGRYNGSSSFNDAGLSSSFWLIENSSFDGTAFSWSDCLNADSANTLLNFNAYNTNNLSWTNFSSYNGTNEVVGPHDLMTTNYNWQVSWFGNFYLPTNSPLITNGSTTADQVGLYEFTTQTNQMPQRTNTVDIGYHYVATDINGNPIDTYIGGIPNYILDFQGNGVDTNGLPYWWEGQNLGVVGLNPNSDPDGNGYSILHAYMNGLNPNDVTTINPIPLGSWNFDNTNTWIGDQGQLPTVAADLTGVLSWETNAVFVDSADAVSGVITTNGNIWAVSGAGSTIVDGVYSPDGYISTNANGLTYIFGNGFAGGIGYEILNVTNGISSPDIYYYTTVNNNIPGSNPFGYWTTSDGANPPPYVQPLVTTNAALLTYGNLQPGGEANFNLRQGTVSFWFLPNWASSNLGGTGPQSEGRFLEIGSQGTANGWWGLAADSAGTNIYFGTQTNSISSLTTNLITAISWTSNVWHQIVLTYTPTNSSLYLDGQPAGTTGAGVSNYPNLAVQGNGFAIGSSLSGTDHADGTFDELKTYNYPVNPAWVWQNYTNAPNPISFFSVLIGSPTNGEVFQ